MAQCFIWSICSIQCSQTRGILFPILYNTYVDDLSRILSESKIGCFIVYIFKPHFDPHLLCLAKTFQMFVKYMKILCRMQGKLCVWLSEPSSFKHAEYLLFTLINGSLLNWVDEHEYVGFILPQTVVILKPCKDCYIIYIAREIYYYNVNFKTSHLRWQKPSATVRPSFIHIK